MFSFNILNIANWTFLNNKKKGKKQEKMYFALNLTHV